MVVRKGEWLANERLADLQFQEHEGVLILGIRHPDGTYIPAPSGDDEIEAGDTVIAYGDEDQLHDLTRRSKEAGESVDRPKKNSRRMVNLQRKLEHDSNT